MTKGITLFILAIVSLTWVSFINKPDFLAEQKNYKNFRTAFKEKDQRVKDNLKAHSINIEKLRTLIVVYKEEEQLELWARNNSDPQYKKIAAYKICYMSGEPGPKRKQGDCQVPEGFYHINMFNPTSTYFLSLGINYPNSSDLKKTTAKDPGNAIFIHGNCVSIGCIAMTDDFIKEIYLYNVYSKHYNQTEIPVYIFPFRMTDRMMDLYSKKYDDKPAVVNFWKNIKKGYDRFQKDRKQLVFKVDKLGDYVLN